MFPSNDHIFKTRTQREVLGQKLALARLKKGLTQMEALRQSGLIHEFNGHTSGVSKGFLTYVEAGKRGITKEQVTVLAKLYGEPVRHFIDNKPLSSGDQRVLARLLDSQRKRSLTTVSGRNKAMSADNGDRTVVTIVRAKTPARRRSAEGLQYASPAVEMPLAPPAPKLPSVSPADLAILSAVKDCSDSEKQWVAGAVTALLRKVKTQSQPPATSRERALSR